MATHPLALAPKRVPAPPPEAEPVSSCPLCGGADSERFLGLTLSRGPAAGAYGLRRCIDCELVFVDPRPANSLLAGLYDQDYYYSTGWPFRGLSERVLVEIQRTRQRRVERWVRRGRLLDIGSGDGRFVRHMASAGWDATGLDFSPAAHALASGQANGGHANGGHANGGRFLHGSIFDHAFEPASVDAVTLWQVLEHVGEPREFLARCHDLMRPGGCFVAAVPNIEGLSAQLTGERWWGLDVPRHLVHYSPRTLCGALERAGFTVMRLNHLSLQYDPYALLHSSLDWVFTRRHFLSDLAKRQVAADVGPAELAWNLAALAALGPVLAPCCALTTVAAAYAGRGGFIEVFARRE